MPRLLLPAVMACCFGAKILIINQSLSLSELAGAAVALILSGVPRTRFYPAVLTLLFGVVVILSRILPWQLAASAKSFQWMPFYGLLHGSLAVDIQSFCEKVFLYGTLLLLMVEAGLGLIAACLAECIALLATSALQTILANRSAEVTDCVIALLLTLVYLILTRQGGASKGERLNASGLRAD